MLQARAAARSARGFLKDEPIHRGEPIPALSREGDARVALFMARAIAHLVSTDDRDEYDKVLADACEALDGGQATDDLAAAMKRWSDASVDEAPRRVPTWLAYSAAAEVDAFFKRKHNGANAFRTVVEAVAILDTRDGKEKALRLLRDLDDELRRLDIVNACSQKRKTPSSAIVRAVWRAAGRDGQATFWLAELANGHYGLLSKQGKTWSWMESELDNVLATVPDEWFEAAVHAAKKQSSDQ